MASRKSGSGRNNDVTAATGAGDVLDDAKQKAGDVVEQAQDKVSQVADQAQQQAKSQLAKGKDRAADGLDSVALALRRTSEQLQEQQEAAAVGNYTSTVADKLSDASHYIRQSDVNELLSQAENYARRQPSVFLGGAFALGMMAARFLKSSGQRLQDFETRRYDSGDSQYAISQYPSASSYSVESTGADYGASGYASSGVSTTPVADVGATYSESTFGAGTGTDLLAEDALATTPGASGGVGIHTPGMSTLVDTDTIGATDATSTGTTSMGTTSTDTTDIATAGVAWSGSDTTDTPRTAEES